jgi:hypothetical protein
MQKIKDRLGIQEQNKKSPAENSAGLLGVGVIV